MTEQQQEKIMEYGKSLIARTITALVGDGFDKETVKAKLIDLGYTKGKGLTLKADESIFTRKDDTVHQLIGKYSIDWVKFEQGMQKNQALMSALIGKQILSASNVDQIKKKTIKRFLKKDGFTSAGSM